MHICILCIYAYALCIAYTHMLLFFFHVNDMFTAAHWRVAAVLPDQHDDQHPDPHPRRLPEEERAGVRADPRGSEAYHCQGWGGLHAWRGDGWDGNWSNGWLLIHTSLSNIRLLQTGDPQRSKDLPTEGQREGSIWGGRRRRRKRWKILFHCKERQPWVHHRLPHRLCHLCLLHGHTGEIYHQKRHLIFMEIDILPVKSIKDQI